MFPFDLLTSVTITEWLSSYGYYILVPILLVEGTVVGFAAGALSSAGVFNPFILFGIFVGVRVVMDTTVYLLARYASSLLRSIEFARNIINKLSPDEEGKKSDFRLLIEENFGKSLFLAKVLPAPSLDTALLIAAGTLNIPLRKVYKAILVGQPLWSALVIGLGYYFGDSIQNPSRAMSIIGLILGALLILVMVYNKYVHNYLLEHTRLGRMMK